MQVFEYDKEKAKREFYTRNLVYWGLVLSFIPFLWALALFLKWLDLDLAGFIAMVFIAVLVAVSFWRFLWRCPRCHKYFFYKLPFPHALTTKCLHCGFRPGRR